MNCKSGSIKVTKTYKQPEHGWVCFHCGETFKNTGSARDHFGETPKEVPGCIIKAGNEKGLLMELRRTQKQLTKIKEAAAYIKNELAFIEKDDLFNLKNNHLENKK